MQRAFGSKLFRCQFSKSAFRLRDAMASEVKWDVHNPDGEKRVVVTKPLPGKRWLEVLKRYRVEICQSDTILSEEDLCQAIKSQPSCHAVIGQLTEKWGKNLFQCLKDQGGIVYSNYAVGFDNVDVDAATSCNIAVGNTPGVLTATTAEMAVALTFAAARRVTEADVFMREERYHGWLPNLLLGKKLSGSTVGIVGCGRIGSHYARSMMLGHGANIVYFSKGENTKLEHFAREYARFCEQQGLPVPTLRRVDSLDTLLQESDVVSIHTSFNKTTHHLISKHELSQMKPDAVLVNTARGPIIDEAALVEHCRRNTDFRVGLDVFEEEPRMKPGLKELPNVVLAPHIASATTWTRNGMATLAACNVRGVLEGFPLWREASTMRFVGEASPPEYIPSLVNADHVYPQPS